MVDFFLKKSNFVLKSSNFFSNIQFFEKFNFSDEFKIPLKYFYCGRHLKNLSFTCWENNCAFNNAKLYSNRCFKSIEAIWRKIEAVEYFYLSFSRFVTRILGLRWSLTERSAWRRSGTSRSWGEKKPSTFRSSSATSGAQVRL